MLHHVEHILAPMGPARVAFHTHHIVKIFHSTKVNKAQPIIAKASRFDGEYCALTSNNGKNATNNVMQLAPSHGMDSNAAEAMQSDNFVLTENFLLNCIIMQI